MSDNTFKCCDDCAYFDNYFWQPPCSECHSMSNWMPKENTELHEKDTPENICIRAVQKWGRQAQIIVAIEELSELQKALCKYLRGDTHNVEEELADVKIMTRQLELMFDSAAVAQWEKDKLERLSRRIDE